MTIKEIAVSAVLVGETVVRVVAVVDNHGRAWTLDGKTWKPLPELPREEEVPGAAR